MNALEQEPAHVVRQASDHRLSQERLGFSGPTLAAAFAEHLHDGAANRFLPHFIAWWNEKSR
jgi:hypothetical protein